MKTIGISVLLIFIPVFFSLTNTNKNEREYNIQSDDFVYDFVDEMPQFPGGEIGLEKYIQDNLIYPKRVAKAGIKGKVYTECIIERDGEVTHEKVYSGISKKLENEALKVIQKFPNWIPGKHKGKIVRVRVTIPVEFK